MKKLPPEDQPDEIWIGPVGPVPIIDEDDPRFRDERAAWSAATRKAQALHSTDEFLSGVRDEDWRVRYESVDRLAARWPDDPRTVEALLDVAASDPSNEARSRAMMRLCDFDAETVELTLRRGLADADEDVRWSAEFSLGQLGLRS